MKKLFTLLFFVVTNAFSEPVYITPTLLCDDTEIIIKKLRETYQEYPLLVGKAGDQAGSVMSMWLNPQTKTWTIIASKDKTTCIIGVGENFELLVDRRKYL